MFFLQSQYAVQSQFPFPSLDQEAVSVVKEGQHDQPQKDVADLYQHHGVSSLGKRPYDVVFQDQPEHKERKHGKNADPDVGEVDGTVFPYIVCRHTGHQ